jgi:methionyl-tRNA formyltransferase
MRIVFIGAVQFSRDALLATLATPAQVVGVCTLQSSVANADHVDLSALCRERGIECRHTPDINAAGNVEWIRSLRPDVVFCFGWSRLLRRPLLDAAPLGVIGFHPAALPANRGRHPLIWALALGLQATATTFFFMGEGADDGDILSQRPIAIDERDDATSLYRRMTDTALAQIAQFVPQLAARTFTRTPQEPHLANTWRKRGRADGQIDWRMSARSIRNLVRALAPPYPGAHFVRAGQDVKVWAAEVVPDRAPNVEPGKILEISPSGPVVACGEQALRLIDTDSTARFTAGEYL